MADNPKTLSPGAKGGTLAAVVGLLSATLLLVETPKEESGRTVQATVATDGTAMVRHVSGPQYLSAYRDIAGVPTACDGITQGVEMGQHYTEAQCGALLEAELTKHARGVMRCTPPLAEPGRDYQRVAAVLLAYNIGVGGYCGSTVARRFNAGEWRAGCDAFDMWNKARVNGVLRPVAGLTARRGRERAICLKGLA
ncbi:glycoside hydrolase family protein [Novosphingobium sp. FGD1]|uniref:Lysozyme n=1 Tax=Novosphingobium silvae TaxID=2692619 RepID=A0A7X4GD48_9SPHN|nr:lysozyme [Novosphingobium silvae]MYL96433.1 glycoside hydrolase family protein [Novosphingobium silvae]